MSSFKPSDALVAAQRKTLARLESISTQFNAQKGAGRFAGKVGILTGVGSEKGIGRATTVLLAREGAKHLYVVDYNADSLPALKESLEARYPGTKITPIEADAGDEAAISAVCNRAISEEGHLDLFFANAGIVGANLLQSTEPDEFMEVFRVNTLRFVASWSCRSDS